MICAFYRKTFVVNETNQIFLNHGIFNWCVQTVQIKRIEQKKIVKIKQKIRKV